MLKSMIIALGVLSLTGSVSSRETVADSPQPETRGQSQVMVLGVFHFDNPGLDVVNFDAGDVLSPEAQLEMNALADALAEWSPTKIMIEGSPESSAALNQRYRDYMAGQRELGRNEIDQIGFRLAKKMGHPRLYAIDSRGHPFDFTGMREAAEKAGQTELLAYLDNRMQALQKDRGTEWAQRPFIDRLIEMNVPEAIEEDHAIYLDMAEAGTQEDPKGAELAKHWWGRNLHIFANMAREAEEGDRILVIFGQGHAHTLRNFIEHARRFDLIEPNPYLRKAQD